MMHKKIQKIEFLDLKNLLFGGIFLSGIGGYPSPPLNGQSLCSKKLSGKGGNPPLTDKIRQVVFESLPKTISKGRYMGYLLECGPFHIYVIVILQKIVVTTNM